MDITGGKEKINDVGSPVIRFGFCERFLILLSRFSKWWF